MIRLAVVAARVFRRVTCGIHAPSFWRLLYRTLESRAAITLAARLVHRKGGDALLRQLNALFVWSGWPHQAYGWINLDASRFLRRVRCAARDRRTASKASPREQQGPLRIGVLGAFAGLLTLTLEHFESAPQEVELHVLDLGYEGRYARYLESVVASYTTEGLARIAGQLDLLYVVGRGPAADEIVDAATTPCIAAFSTGSDLFHHDKVDFHLYPQPEADYFVRSNRIYCGTSRRPFGSELVYPGFFLYDQAGIAPGAPWSEREPLVLIHGSLFKAANDGFLDALLPLLSDGVDLVLMGRAREGELETVNRAARRHGVESRVHYDGEFATTRDAAGRREGAGWQKLLGHLARARLAPDPWPIGGGAARAEAYAAGVPTAHLAVRFDEAAWGRRQHALLEVEALQVEEATAWNPDEYRRLCERCLHDRDFAHSLVAAQRAVCERVTDARAYWLQLVEAHRDWNARGRPGYAGAR